jgi:hypothetical protein
MSTPTFNGVRIDQLPQISGLTGNELIPLSQNGIVFSVLSAALRNSNVYVQGSPPPAAASDDLWINTAQGNALFYWSGSAWDPASDDRLPTDDEKAALTAAGIVFGDVVATRGWASNEFETSADADDFKDDVVAYGASSSNAPDLTFPTANTRVYSFRCTSISAISATVPTTNRRTGDLLFFRNVNGSPTVQLGSVYQSTVGSAPAYVALVYDGVQWQVLETSLDNSLGAAQPSLASTVVIAGAGATSVTLTDAEFATKASVYRRFSVSAGTFANTIQFTAPPAGPPAVTNTTKMLYVRLEFAASGVQTIDVEVWNGASFTAVDSIVSNDGDDEAAYLTIYWPTPGTPQLLAGIYPA